MIKSRDTVIVLRNNILLGIPSKVPSASSEHKNIGESLDILHSTILCITYEAVTVRWQST